MSEGVKNVIVIIYNLYNLVCWKIFYIWIKSVLGNYETTLYSYFLSGDIDWYGYRWTDVHCFSIVDHWWHYSIGDVTFIMDQEEEIQQAEEELCIRFAAEYHEYLERIGLASVEEHELTGLTKDIRLDVVAVTKEYRALYGPDTVSWYRSYEAEIR